MWKNHLRNLSARRSQRARGRDRQGGQGGTFRPLLETLEDRLTPSASAFAQSAGGLLQDSGQGVGTDGLGNVYVAGNIQGASNEIDTDGYVAKYNASGVPVWSQLLSGHDELGNSFGDSANSIAVDRAGNSYVAGSFRAMLNFGNNIVLTSTGAIDGFVEKLDTNGTVQWAHQFASNGNFGPPLYDRLGTLAPKAIAVDHAGNVVVTGIFSGHMDMDPAHPGQHFLDYPNVHPGGYVVKLDANGNFMWEAQAVNPLDNINANAIAVDAHNGVYVLGNFGNFNYFNDTTANNSDQQSPNALTLTGPNITNLYVWKLNADGANAWVSQVDSQAYNAPVWGLGIAVDTHGAIYTTGSFNGANLDFDPTVSHAGTPPPDIITSASGNYDTYVNKMDSGGHFLWVRQITSTGDNWGTGLALDSAGNPYITGYVSADSVLGNILLTPASAAGNSYIAELSPQGDFLCAQKSVDLDPNGDKAVAIAVDAQGFVDITGAYATQMQWPGLPLLNSNSGSTDIFTVKTQLTCSPVITTLNGHILNIVGTSGPDLIEITDDRHWGILVGLAGGEQRVFSGSVVDQIEVTAMGGDDQVVISIQGFVPLQMMTVDLGSGQNRALIALLMPAGEGSLPAVQSLTVHGGSDNDIVTLRCPDDNLPPNVLVDTGAGDDQVTLASGSYHPAANAPPCQISIDTGDGNDRAAATFGDILGGTLSFHLTLGRGDDTAVIQHVGGIGGSAQFLGMVDGNDGDDSIRFEGTGGAEMMPLVANADALVAWSFNGGPGDDSLISTYGGPNMPVTVEHRVTTSGGAGNDHIIEHWEEIDAPLYLTDEGSDGNDVVTAEFGVGTGPLFYQANLGNGSDQALVGLLMSGTTGSGPISGGQVPAVHIAVSGGNGADTISVETDDREWLNAICCLMPALDVTLDGGEGPDSLAFAERNALASAPESVTLLGGLGNDIASVTHHNVTVCAPVTERLLLGDGADTASILDDGVVLTGALTQDIDLGDGRNVATVVILGGTAGPGSVFDLDVRGGANADTIRLTVQGLLVSNASWGACLNGGAGSDEKIDARLDFVPGNTGPTMIQVMGGTGNDDLTLLVSAFSNPDDLLAVIAGGSGTDTGHYTANVVVISIER